jgi:guanine deaminase
MTSLRCRVLSPESPTSVRWIPDAIVTFDAGRITAVGPYQGEHVDQNLGSMVLTPGFVDAHLHYPQTRIIGAATGPLLPWLQQSVFPEEARFADKGHAETVARLFCNQLAAAGTTLSMVYGSAHPVAADALFEALDARGLRAIAGPVWMDDDCPDALKHPTAAAEQTVRALADRWADHPRLEVAVIPRFALSCTREMLAAAGSLSRELGLWASTHVSENIDECTVATERFGTPDYLRVYEDAGLVHERSVFAHCIHLSDSEWDRMAAAKSVVAHCPDSNFFLGSGRMPISDVLERGIALAIGTDVAAGRTFSIRRILASVFDNALATGHRVTPAELLWWGTRGGAQALGHPELGAVEVGFGADLCAWELPDWVEDETAALSWLLMSHDLVGPATVWVGGRDLSTTGGR